MSLQSDYCLKQKVYGPTSSRETTGRVYGGREGKGGDRPEEFYRKQNLHLLERGCLRQNLYAYLLFQW